MSASNIRSTQDYFPASQSISSPGPQQSDDPIDHCDAARQYALALGSRVRSFETDPLHSTAYLNYLAKYLKGPSQKQSRRQQSSSAQSTSRRIFVHQYNLQATLKPEYRSFADVHAYRTEPPSVGNEIVFLAGRPSADWLNVVGSRYQVNHRFFHQHLGHILTNQRHWCAIPTLPSRSMGMLRLCVPSIVFIGSQGRDVDVLGLELARSDCNDRLRRSFKSIQDSSDAGESMIRRVHIHNGSTLVVEQEMTMTVVKRGENWTCKLATLPVISICANIFLLLVLIWTDAGDDTGHDHIPVPHTPGFLTVSSQVEFCPVFFENQLTETPDEPGDFPPTVKLAKQPFALLSSNYGATLDWDMYTDQSPLFVVQELLAFEAASALQYINMIEQVLSDHMRGSKFPSYEHTKLETVLHFDYAKAILARLETHFADVLAFLDNLPCTWKLKSPLSSPDVPRGISLIKGDFRYLISRVTRLLSICDAGKATLISNASVQEAKRSAEESKLVTELTKATNRVTFIFLPISYVTAVFGMNFKQFGQGGLSIWLWAVVSLPLFIFSVIIVERGSWIKKIWRKRL